MKKITVLLVSAAILFSCVPQKNKNDATEWNKRNDTMMRAVFRQKHSANPIVSISLATEYSTGKKMSVAYKIDSSGTVSFFGGGAAFHKGFYTGNVYSNIWNQMLSILDTTPVRKFAGHYSNPKGDFIQDQLVIVYKSDKVDINGATIAMPKSIKDAYYRLSKLLYYLKLTPTTKILPFETTIQFTKEEQEKYLGK